MINIWIVVQSKRGFIEEPEIFFSLKEAKLRKSSLLKIINPDYDEIDLFEKRIALPTKQLIK